MAPRTKLPELPPNAWQAAGSFDDPERGVTEVLKHLHAIPYSEHQMYENESGFMIISRWEERRGPRPVKVSSCLMMAPNMESADGVTVLDLPAAQSLSLDELLTHALQAASAPRSIDWSVVAIAQEEKLWDHDWPSPARTLLASKACQWQHTKLGEPSLIRRDSKAPAATELSIMRQLARRFSELHAYNTILISTETEGVSAQTEAEEKIKHLARGDTDSCPVLAITPGQLHEMNRALGHHKVGLPRGGAVILPHTPPKNIPRKSLVLSAEEVADGTSLGHRLRQYLQLPSHVDPRCMGALRQLQKALEFAESGAPAAEPVASAHRCREDELLKELKEVRERLIEVQTGYQELLGAKEEAAHSRSRVVELERMLNESAQYRLAAATALRWQEALEELELTTAALEDEVALSNWLRRQLAEAKRIDAFTDMPPPERGDFASWDEMLAMAEELLPYVVVGPEVRDAAAKLSSAPSAGAWIDKAWKILSTLNNYGAAYKEYGDRKELASVATFLRWPDADREISAMAHRPRESATVSGVEELRAARMFPVPHSVSSNGLGFMAEHFVIAQTAGLAPRLHFLDATRIDGRVHVGYIGPHLPIPRA